MTNSPRKPAHEVLEDPLSAMQASATPAEADTVASLPLPPVARDFHALSTQLSGVEQRMALRDGHVANDVNALLNAMLPQFQRLQTVETSLANLSTQVLSILDMVQRISGSLANTDNRLQNQAAQLVSVDQRLSEAHGRLDGIAHVAQHVQSAVSTFSGQLANTDNRLQNQDAQLSAIDRRISESLGALDGIAHVAQHVQSTVSPLSGLIANTDNRLQNQEAQLSAIDRRISETQGALDGIAHVALHVQSTVSPLSGLIANTDNRLQNQEAQLAAIDRRISESQGALDGVAHVAQHVQATVSPLSGHLANTDNRLESTYFRVSQTDERISAIEGAIANLGNRLDNARAVLDGAFAGVAGIASTQATLANAAPRDDALKETMALLLARATATLASRAGVTQPKLKVAAPRAGLSLKAQMAELKKAAPVNYAAWHKAYELGVAEGQRTVEGNLSHDGHVGATYFRMFIDIHARGRLLDIGCGPLPLPSYLADWPVDAIAGMDPQAPFDVPHPFPFAVSFAETLAWPDASFETVVIGTSLDHIYLLDKALAEIKRVLVPGGRLLIWTAIFEWTAPYDPYSKPIEVPDQYHLFHPGRNWFYKLFEADYRLIERMATVASAEFLAFERK